MLPWCVRLASQSRFRGPGYVVRAGQGPLFVPGGRLLDGVECRGHELRALEPLRDRELELELRRRLTLPSSIVPRQPFVLS